MCFGQCFESGGVGAVSDVLWKGVPEGGGSEEEGSVPPGSELGSWGDREEVRFWWTKAAGRGVVVDQVGEVGVDD